MSPWKPLCDFQTGDTDKPCLDDAPIEVSVSFEGRSYRALLCKTHGLALVNAGEPTTPAQSKVTFLPKVGPKTPTVDSATKEWAVKKGGDLAAAINQRGRQPKDLKERFLASAEGKVWAKNQGS